MLSCGTGWRRLGTRDGEAGKWEETVDVRFWDWVRGVEMRDGGCRKDAGGDSEC